MFVTSYSVTCCIYVPGKPGICFRYYCAGNDECKYSDTCWLADRTRLFVQYTISWSSLCKIYLKALNLLNACQIYFVECVSKIKHILSVIHYTLCGAVCFQFTHFPCDNWDNIYNLVIIIIKSKVWTYYPLFRVRSWNNCVRCMSFYILIVKIGYVCLSYGNGILWFCKVTLPSPPDIGEIWFMHTVWPYCNKVEQFA